MSAISAWWSVALWDMLKINYIGIYLGTSHTWVLVIFWAVYIYNNLQCNSVLRDMNFWTLLLFKSVQFLFLFLRPLDAHFSPGSSEFKRKAKTGTLHSIFDLTFKMTNFNGVQEADYSVLWSSINRKLQAESKYLREMQTNKQEKSFKRQLR